MTTGETNEAAGSQTAEAQPSRASVNGSAVRVKYKTRGNSGREWDVIFDLGSDARNSDAAVDYAWKHNATISASGRWVSALTKPRTPA